MKTLFIIRASSGIGEKLAHYAAQQGVSLALFARSTSLAILNQTAQTLSQQYRIVASAFALDMTDDPQTILTALDTAQQNNPLFCPHCGECGFVLVNLFKSIG